MTEQEFWKCFTKTKEHTIIFSNRAKISFSEVIFDDSSSKWCEVEDEELDESFALCLDCVKGGRSFLLPGIRMLANLSSYRKKAQLKEEKLLKSFQSQVKVIKSTFKWLVRRQSRQKSY